MAGRGSRFTEKGYKLPKPLIEIHGKAMIQLVIDNLKPQRQHRFIFLCLKEHISEYDIDKKLQGWTPGSEILTVDQVTEGAACTVLLAKEFINNDDPLMIANSDQWVDIAIDDYLSKLDNVDLDGFIMTMTANDHKWSFVQFNDKQEIIGVIEKQVVSSEATVGIYNYRHGSDFVAAAEQMIENNLRVNNEFYVAPVYNEMIANGKKCGFFNIGNDQEKMHGLGTPSDLEHFIELPISQKVTT